MYILLQLRFIIAMIWTDSMTKRKRNQPLDLEVTIHHNS